MKVFKIPPFEVELDKHHCPLAVVGCMDFRFRRSRHRFIEDELGIRDFDTLNLPGGAKIFAYASPLRAECVTAIAKVCVGLHGAKKVLLMTHWDCGAYGGSTTFASPEAEESAYVKDLVLARSYLMEQFPDLEILCAYSRATDQDLEYVLLEESDLDSERAA